MEGKLAYQAEYWFDKLKDGRSCHATLVVGYWSDDFIISHAFRTLSGVVACSVRIGKPGKDTGVDPSTGRGIVGLHFVDSMIRSGSLNGGHLELMIKAAERLGEDVPGLDLDPRLRDCVGKFAASLASYLKRMASPSRIQFTSYGYEPSRWKRAEWPEMLPQDEAEFLERVSSSKFGCRILGGVYRMVGDSGTNPALYRLIPEFEDEYMEWADRSEGKFSVTADGKMFRWLIRFHGRLLEPAGERGGNLIAVDVATGKAVEIPKDEVAMECAFV